MSNLADLILRGGAQQAAFAQNRADILGSTVAGLGQDIGGYIQQRDERRAVSARAQALMELASRPDASPEEFFRVGGPDGIKFYEGLTSAKKAHMELERGNKAAAEAETVNATRKYLALPEDVRAESWPALRELYLKNGLPEAMVPPEHTAEADGRIKGFIDRLDPKAAQAPVKGSPGDVFFDPVTREKVFSVPEAARPTNRANFQAVPTAEGIRAFDPESGTLGAVIGQAPPRDTGSRAGLTPNAEAGLIAKLNAQYTKAAAPAIEIDRQLKLMDAGLNAAKKGDMASGSQAVLVTFQKILDPTSVVRESEYARSASGLAMLSRVKGAFERLQKGGAGVPLEELEKFANLAREASKAFSGGYLDSVKKRVGATAGRYQIPEDLVIEDYSFGGAPEGTPAPGAPTVTRKKFNPATGMVE